MKLGKRKKKSCICANLKQTSTKYGATLWGVLGNDGKDSICKKDMDESICLSCFCQ